MVTSAYQRMALTEECYCRQSELQREFAQDSHASAFVELKDAAPRRHCQMEIRWETRWELLKDIERLIISNYCILLFISFKEGQRPKSIRRPSEQDCSA